MGTGAIAVLGSAGFVALGNSVPSGGGGCSGNTLTDAEPDRANDAGWGNAGIPIAPVLNLAGVTWSELEGQEEEDSEPQESPNP